MIAALVLALCLAGASRAGLGIIAPQQQPSGRQHSATATTTRVPQARSSQAPSMDSALQPGNPAAMIALTATGLALALGVLHFRACPVARRSGRSPPQFA